MDNNTDHFLQDRLNALVDGRLPADQQADTLARLAVDETARDTLQAWQFQRDALRGLHRSVLDEPVPEALLAAAQHGQHSRRAANTWWRWGGMAAGLMLAFGVGWLSRGPLLNTSATSQLAAATARPTQAFVQQASFAHAAFSPEVRHPVEVTAAQQDHLVQWLSKRLGKPLKVPVLATQGYELVGGRLLPGDGGNGGVRAQFMFQNAGGGRITLFLGAIDTAATPAPNASAPSINAGETAFRYSNSGPVPSFYWVDQGFGYALSGAVSQAELMQLAQLVYQQL